MAGVGTNRYAYAGNDMVNKSDPNGHNWQAVKDFFGFGKSTSRDRQDVGQKEGPSGFKSYVSNSVTSLAKAPNDIISLTRKAKKDPIGALSDVGDAVDGLPGGKTATGTIKASGILLGVLAGTKKTSSKLDDMSQAAKIVDRNGLTKAGRALQKHGDRVDSAFPAAKGKAQTVNQQAQDIVDDILTDPKSLINTRQTHRYGSVTEVISPDGRGIRYGGDGGFVGFLEPN